MYQDVIRWWMQNSKFDIYIVDSSNNAFDDDIEQACKIHHFDQTQCFDNFEKVKLLARKISSTTLETISLTKMIEVYGKEWADNYHYVIKLTGKYTLPDLEKLLKESVKDDSNDFICQSKFRYNVQHSELMLCKANIMKQLITEISEISDTPFCMFEKKLYIVSRTKKFMNLKKIINTSKYKRGAGDLMLSL